jgi:glutathione S-transferase
MITLYTFGAAFGLPDASPFVTKVHVLLKMAGQPYRTNTKGYTKSPKSKLPFIDDDGTVVADSTFIRWHLEKKYGIDFDQGLSPEQRAMAWAAEKLIEDNLYWIGLYWRWMDDNAFAKVVSTMFKPLPQPFRALVGHIARGRIRKSLHAQGTGRHSPEEMTAIGRQGMSALATLLGDKPYVMGDQPCSTDAMLFGAINSSLCPHFEHPMKAVIKAHPNLVAYEARMRQRYFPANGEGAPPR